MHGRTEGNQPTNHIHIHDDDETHVCVCVSVPAYTTRDNVDDDVRGGSVVVGLLLPAVFCATVSTWWASAVAYVCKRVSAI